ncbi:MAG: 16S rRNA (guanine(527)-N(7))-methyltransferase RsmG [Rhizobiaceae bacterium]
MTERAAYSDASQFANVSRETQRRLTDFHDLLVQWQAKTNLIANSTLDQIWQRHIFDSLQVYEALGEAGSIIDIGSGAGFPGLVIAILLAEEGRGSVHLIESNGKKCAFLNACIRKAGLREAGVSVQVHNQRVEHALPNLAPAEVITARALASLDDLLRLTQSHLAAGAVGIFPKGRDHKKEIEFARRNWQFDCTLINSDLQEGSVILKISELKPS